MHPRRVALRAKVCMLIEFELLVLCCWPRMALCAAVCVGRVILRPSGHPVLCATRSSPLPELWDLCLFLCAHQVHLCTTM